MDTTLQCQWCGAYGPPEEFELDEENSDGFWCPDCDGHTFYDEARNLQRRILLLLESKDRDAGENITAPKRKLKKQLSPLRYPGGKSKIIDYLAGWLHEDQMDTFVEVFAGGASIGLSLLDAELTRKLVLNDLDPAIYAFWWTALNRPEYLYAKLDSDPPTRNEFYAAKAVLKSIAGLPSTIWEPGTHFSGTALIPRIEEVARAQLVCNRLSFSGITRNEVGPMGGKYGDDATMLSRWNPKALKRRIAGVYAMRDRIEVTCIDATELIETVSYWDEKSTLFIDPPYVQQGKELYREYYEIGNHEELAFLLQSLYTGMPGADIIITYDDCPLIREIYPLAEVHVIGRYFSCGKRS